MLYAINKVMILNYYMASNILLLNANYYYLKNKIKKNVLDVIF